MNIVISIVTLVCRGPRFKWVVPPAPPGSTSAYRPARGELFFRAPLRTYAVAQQSGELLCRNRQGEERIWLLVWNIFSIQWGIIIPTDFDIFRFLLFRSVGNFIILIDYIIFFGGVRFNHQPGTLGHEVLVVSIRQRSLDNVWKRCPFPRLEDGNSVKDTVVQQGAGHGATVTAAKKKSGALRSGVFGLIYKVASNNVNP